MRGILSRAYAEGGFIMPQNDFGDYFEDPNEEDGGVLNIMQARSDSVPVAGAIAPRINPADAQRLSDIDRASRRIEEMQQAREASRNGGINLPLLAAAGAMLGPTKTGQFGESLSNSIGAAVPLAQKERALEEQTQMRLAQQEWNAAVKKAELADRSEGRSLQERRDKATDEYRKGMLDTARFRAVTAANKPVAESSDKVAARMANELADIKITEEDAARIARGESPMTQGEKTQFRVSAFGSAMQTAKPPRSSGSTSINSILASNALTIADADIAKRTDAGETLSDADKARIRNEFVQKAKYESSVYSHTLNAAQGEAMEKILAARPEIANDPVAIGRLLYQIKGKGLLSAEKLNELSDRSSQIGYSLNTLDDAEKILNSTLAVAGLPGSVARSVESVFNLLGSDQTARNDFESKVTLARTFAGELLGSKNMNFTAKERQDLNKIIRGLETGDTVPNVKSSFNMLRDIYMSKLNANRGEYVANTGDDLPFFKQQPTDRPAPAPDVAPGAPAGVAPAVAPRPAPAAVAAPTRPAAPSQAAPLTSTANMTPQQRQKMVADAAEGWRMKQGDTWFVKRNGQMVPE